MITAQSLKLVCPNCKLPELWAPLLEDGFKQRGLDTKTKQAAFISQTAHESGEYNVLTENLNYSAERLVVVFPKYFPSIAQAAPFGRNPKAIANKVYANRMGNGPETSGDGYKFRGRGVLQLTGKNNYSQCSKFLYGLEEVLVNDPDKLLAPEGAMASAFWFWTANKLASIADFVALTKRINGGTHGLPDRVAKYNKALAVL